nr:hypothetical protein [Tanacetum cinerariifolium]
MILLCILSPVVEVVIGVVMMNDLFNYEEKMICRILSRKYILKGLYQSTTVTIPVVPATTDSLAVPERTIVETILTMSPINKAYYESENEEIHLLLTEIWDEIYSTIYACKTAHEMRIAIERIQQDSMESYYSIFYKMMNEMIRNNLTVAMMQVNVQFLQQLQPEWSRTVTVAGAKKTVGSQETKRVKDSTYHKEKMLLCKEAEKGVPLEAKQADWLEETDEEIDKQELEAHYSFMAKIQEVPNADSETNTELLEQTDQNAEDERAALANLIANLKLDVDENKKTQKQLKKANASLTHELKECKSILAETSRTLGESNSIWDSCLIALQNKHTKFERIPKLSVLGKSAPFSESLERKIFSLTKSVPKTNVSESLSKPAITQIFPQTTRPAVRNTHGIKPCMYRIDTWTTQTGAPQLSHISRNTNPHMSTSTGVIHKTNVSRPQLRSTQMKDKVVPNNIQVKDKKTEVEDHHKISSIYNKTSL